ncbi:MAG TPA: MFS transporter [Terriglobia bacterium]|nr:MFS transporter [Terriglobia bacterium]
MKNLRTLSTKVEQPQSARRDLHPTGVRKGIFGLVVIIMAVAALDRLNLSIAGKTIQDQFALSTQAMGYVFGAFFLGYAIFQVPWGYAADRYGPHRVMTFAILFWSVFTIVVGLAPHFALGTWFTVAWSIAVIRFLVGVGEAAASPAINKIVALWMDETQRGAGMSYMSVGFGLGGIFTPILIAWTTQHWGWRASFYLSGILGSVVAIVWWCYATNRPEEHPRINAAELELIRPRAERTAGASQKGSVLQRLPWIRMLSSRSVWGLLVSYSFQNYAFFVYYDWFYIYLIRGRGLTMKQGSVWTSTPFIAVTLLALLGGWLSDRAVQRFGKYRGRQSTVWVGVACSPLLLLIGAHTHNNLIAIPLLAAAAGFNFFSLPAWWAACIDLMPNYSASLSALMNSFGNFAGCLSPVVTAYIITRFGWTRALDLTALITLAPGLIWFFVNASENLEASVGNFVGPR